MSLINQMLKDLEVRSKSSVHPEAVLAGLQATDEKIASKKIRVLMFLISLLALILFGAWHFYPQKTAIFAFFQKAAKTKLGLPHKPAMALANPAKTVPPKTIASQGSLTGVSMQAHGKMTYLRFLLSQEMIYRLDSNPLEHSLTLILQHAHLGVTLPPLDFVNTALSDLQVKSESNDELKIVMKLKPEAKLSNLELNKESQFPELQADLLLEGPTLPKQEAVKEERSEGLKKVPVALSTEEEYQSALNLAEAGQLDQAIQHLVLIVDHYPDYHAARAALIRFLMQNGHQEQAENLLEVGLGLQPYYPPYVEIQARLWVDEGKVRQALQLLKKAPPPLSTHPGYYAFIAALYQRLGQLPAAENLYQQLTTLHPEKGLWWLGLGVTEESLGKTEQAMEAYARADRSPDLDPELRGYVGSRLRG